MAYVAGKNNTRTFVNEHKLKEQMCDIGRRIWLKGFCAGNEGNHSYRIGEDRFLCTPTGVSKGNLKPDDICLVDGSGKQISGKLKRSSEFMMHAAIFKARPEVNAVIHSHPPHATAFAVAGVEIPTCIHPEAEVFLGPVRTAKYVTPGDQRLGESILPYVKESNTIILQNHGVVCFNADLEQAYYQLEIIDAYSRILLLAKGLGSVKMLTSDEMSELIRLKERFGIPDPRMADAKAGSVSCATSDYAARVGGETGSRGRMMVGDVATSLMSKIDPGASSGQITDAQFELMVQTITDQIMASGQ